MRIALTGVDGAVHLEDDSARGYYVIGNGLNPTVAELTTQPGLAPSSVGVPSGAGRRAPQR